MLKMAIKCLQCCLWCFEKTVRFVTGYGFVYVAMEGGRFRGRGRCRGRVTYTYLLHTHLVRRVPRVQNDISRTSPLHLLDISPTGSAFCSACFSTFKLILGNLAQVAVNTYPDP